jgi:hypothetical protein
MEVQSVARIKLDCKADVEEGSSGGGSSGSVVGLALPSRDGDFERLDVPDLLLSLVSVQSSLKRERRTSAYCMTARSAENLPILAVVRMVFSIQAGRLT